MYKYNNNAEHYNTSLLYKYNNNAEHYNTSLLYKYNNNAEHYNTSLLYKYNNNAEHYNTSLLYKYNNNAEHYNTSLLYKYNNNAEHFVLRCGTFKNKREALRVVIEDIDKKPREGDILDAAMYLVTMYYGNILEKDIRRKLVII